mgnify:CR=1 FL=1
MLGILLSKLFFSLNFIYSQISNSRKSFIFSKSIDDEEINEYSKKKIDLDTIILKLKLKIYNNILETIGNTPLVKMNQMIEDMGVSATVLAKVETTNPGNSIKDRMAVKMIEDAEKDDQIEGLQAEL